MLHATIAITSINMRVEKEKLTESVTQISKQEILRTLCQFTRHHPSYALVVPAFSSFFQHHGDNASTFSHVLSSELIHPLIDEWMHADLSQWPSENPAIRCLLTLSHLSLTCLSAAAMHLLTSTPVHQHEKAQWLMRRLLHTLRLLLLHHHQQQQHSDNMQEQAITPWQPPSTTTSLTESPDNSQDATLVQLQQQCLSTFQSALSTDSMLLLAYSLEQEPAWMLECAMQCAPWILQLRACLQESDGQHYAWQLLPALAAFPSPLFTQLVFPTSPLNRQPPLPS
jgi:hypothetical protein